jgi:CSLREA domain-containing protein
MKYLSVLFLLIFAISAQAANYIVTRSDDRNGTCNSGVDCSLREAIKAANNSPTDDVVNFSGVSLITLTNEIIINNAGTLSIVGGGADVFTIDGSAGSNRLFSIVSANVSISGVKLSGGNGKGIDNSGFGGAILVNGGRLTFDSVHVANNKATEGNGGGVLFLGGVHSITNSTFSANSANDCGAFFSAGNSVLTVFNSTISNNTAENSAGGGLCNNSNLTLRNVTITDNTARISGGIHQFNGTLNLSNTIVAENIALDNISSEIRFGGGAITSDGNNFIGDSQGDSSNTGYFIAYQLSDILERNPLLGALQNNGGTTPTHALLIGSRAINGGNNSNAPAGTDQRGFARIVGGIIDIGAFESDTPAPPPPPCNFLITPASQDFNSAGGTGTITVTGQAGCPYSSLNESSFVTLNSGAEGTGNGTVNFTVAPNNSAARSVTIFVAGQNFTVNQVAGVKSRKRTRFF